jgi:hypothetical protein
MKNLLFVGNSLGHKTFIRRSKNLKGRTAGNQVHFLILVNFLSLGYRYACPIQIPIQESQINVDPDPQHRSIESFYYGEL